MSSRVIIAYKNFAAHKNVSHIGLGVAGINNTKMLRRTGTPAEVWPIVHVNQLHEKLLQAGSSPCQRPTHVVISAPWIPTAALAQLAATFPETTFAVNCHSNVGFLQADPQGVQLFREAMELQRGTHNFQIAGNSAKFCRWVRAAFAAPCAFLPNLYYLDAAQGRPDRPLYGGGTLRIGAFGATRPLKNFLSAAGAALQIGQQLHTNLELWISAGRSEGGGDTVLNAARSLFRGLPHARLVESGWQSWPQFRQTVAHMHLLLQPSYTESFNMVTADGVAEGLSSVVSSAIDWAPRNWRAEVDDVGQIARRGLSLLADPDAARNGWNALQAHNRQGLAAWEKFLRQPGNWRVRLRRFLTGR